MIDRQGSANALVQRRSSVPLGAVEEDRSPGALQLREDYERVRAQQDESVPRNTRRAYELEFQCWISWCTRRGLRPIPADPRALVVYMRELAHSGRDSRDLQDEFPKGPLKFSSIQRALGAICRLHQRNNHPSPWGMQCVVEARQALQRELGVRPNKKKAATEEILRAIVDQIPTGTLRGARDRAMILLADKVAGRRSEVAGALVEHFEQGTDSKGSPGLIWFVPKSKSDQAGQGEHVPIKLVADRRYCAITALKVWAERSGIRSGPLFRGIDAHDHLYDGAITPSVVATRVKVYAQAAGFDPNDFGGHSLRSGRITQLAKQGETSHAIKRISRHKSTAVLEGYIQYANLLDDVPGEQR